MAMVAFYVASHSPRTATLNMADTLLLMGSGLLFGIGVLALVGKLKI